jgi:molybdate transport system ATP-binding protein
MTLNVDFALTLCSARREFGLQVKFDSEDPRVVVFGPSGAGKSATLQAIAGLLRPTRGHISVDGRVLFDAARGIDVPARKRRVGYVFQDYALFPHLTVRDNIAYGLKRLTRWRLSAAEQQRLAGLMDLFDLEPMARAMPRELSGGQRQRVALARALIAEPSLLLLDEPFAALDVRLRNRMREELVEMQHRFRVPMVLITHDLKDVEQLAQTLVVLDMGKVSRTVSLPRPSELPAGSVAGELAALCGVA